VFCPKPALMPLLTIVLLGVLADVHHLGAGVGLLAVGREGDE
jgi:hypothetical protein